MRPPALRAAPEGRVFADFIAEAQGDPLLAEAFRSRFLAERRRVVATMWNRGVERGEFRADVDVNVAMDMTDIAWASPTRVHDEQLVQ
jgi:hypothetical protein